MKEEGQLWISSKCATLTLGALNPKLISNKETVNRSDCLTLACTHAV